MMVFDQHFRIVASKDPLEEGPIVEGQGGQEILGHLLNFGARHLADGAPHAKPPHS